MEYRIRFAEPEVKNYWDELRKKYHDETATKNEQSIYKKWFKALKLLSENPRHPSLKTHDIDPLTKRYGRKVWQSYLENKNSRAMRMYWFYGPDKDEITIIGLDPHPEDKKNGAYNRIILSTL